MLLSLAKRPAVVDSRRFHRNLALLCAAALVQQAVLLLTAWRDNPFARTPVEDAAVYWDWAAAIAGGQWVGERPFLSAPLYPYLLGIVRGLGGELPLVYALQAILRSATAWLLAATARPRYGPRIALAAALLFLLLDDPAFSCGRVLNGTLQTFTAVLLWRSLPPPDAAVTGRRAGAAGAALGLAVLANPALLLAVPLLPLWIGWRSRPRRLGAAGITLAAALLCISPATLHNWLASGEFIPVSAQSGVTFFHGNAPGARGIYHPIEGVSADRQRQNFDAYRMAAEATGEKGWRATSSYFLGRGLEWWRSEPLAAITVGLRKLWHFLSDHSYGDVYQRRLEGRAGFAPLAWLAPLWVALLTLPAAVGAGLLRPRSRHLPEIALALLPLVVVALFFYTPRYRLPATPFLALLTAAGAARAWALLPAARRLPVLAAGAAGWTATVITLAPSHPGFEALFENQVGIVYEKQKDWDRAAERFRRAWELGHEPARSSLGNALRRAGREEEGRELLRQAAEARPTDAVARLNFGVALAESGSLTAAEAEFRAALSLDPQLWEARSGLGNVLREQGRPDQALAQYREALAIRPDFAPAWFNLGVSHADLGQLEEAADAHRNALRWAPELVPALDALAWILATAPDPALRDAPEAVRLAQRAVGLAGPEPTLLETLSQAFAADGRMADAARTARQASRAAAAAGLDDYARELENRARRFESQ